MEINVINYDSLILSKAAPQVVHVAMMMDIVRSCTELPLSNIIHDMQNSNVVSHGNSSIGR